MHVGIKIYNNNPLLSPSSSSLPTFVVVMEARVVAMVTLMTVPFFVVDEIVVICGTFVVINGLDVVVFVS